MSPADLMQSSASVNAFWSFAVMTTRFRVYKRVRELHVPRRASAFSNTKHASLTLHRAERPDRPLPYLGYLPLTAIRFTFDCACGAFGMVTVKTPFLNAADTLSSSTSSTGILRSNRP